MLRRPFEFLRRHKKWAFAWLALECVVFAAGAPALADLIGALPNQAQPQLEVSQSHIGPGAIALEIRTDAPFVIAANNYRGPLQLNIKGTSDTAPEINQCVHISSDSPSRIYNAHANLARENTQFKVSMTYFGDESPDIEVYTIGDAQIPALLSLPCRG